MYVCCSLLTKSIQIEYIMKKNMLKIALLFVVLMTTSYLFAQTPPANRPPPPPGLPIDGGIFTLVAVAFGYGVSKLRNKK